MNTQRNADLLEKLKLRKSARLLARALAVGANSKEGGGLFLGQVVPVRGAGRAGSGGNCRFGIQASTGRQCTGLGVSSTRSPCLQLLNCKGPAPPTVAPRARARARAWAPRTPV